MWEKNSKVTMSIVTHDVFCTRLIRLHERMPELARLAVAAEEHTAAGATNCTPIARGRAIERKVLQGLKVGDRAMRLGA